MIKEKKRTKAEARISKAQQANIQAQAQANHRDS